MLSIINACETWLLSVPKVKTPLSLYMTQLPIQSNGPPDICATLNNHANLFMRLVPVPGMSLLSPFPFGTTFRESRRAKFYSIIYRRSIRVFRHPKLNMANHGLLCLPIRTSRNPVFRRKCPLHVKDRRATSIVASAFLAVNRIS